MGNRGFVPGFGAGVKMGRAKRSAESNSPEFGFLPTEIPIQRPAWGHYFPKGVLSAFLAKSMEYLPNPWRSWLAGISGDFLQLIEDIVNEAVGFSGRFSCPSGRTTTALM
jgi:hypothetical protein